MTTPEQIQQWAREAGAVIDHHWGLASNVGTATFERFAILARADLEAENASLRTLLNTYNLGGWTDSLELIKERDALMADYNNVSTENEELRAKMLAMACIQVDLEESLKADADALHAALKRITEAAEKYILLGHTARKWDALNEAIDVARAAMKDQDET
jgi:hypothetical protein